ncbi:MAG: Membrane protein insertase YidC [Chlamydiae bacterium]|nr:Membrane protein insertase YidC [Chlamydiota bacterium]
MNKRFIIFVLSMTTLFFFVNQYYTSKKQQEYQAYQARKEKIAQEERVANQKNASERTANLNQLPVVRIYDEERAVSWAVVTEKDSYLTISWQKEWPKSVTIEGKSATLIQTDDHFALYSSSPNPGISSTYVPQVGTHDLQVVTFSGGEEAEVVLAEFDDGQLFFPAFLPKWDAIVLYQSGGSFFPVGVYNSSNQSFKPLSKLTHFNALTEYRIESLPQKTIDQQKFYVLENESMQVVFSNLGGAIAEINLPFRTEKDSESVVLPIDFDRIIDKRYPSNALFPLNPYHVSQRESGETILKQPTKGGYYPLLRRGIEPGSSYPPYTIPPRYYAFNTISEDPESSEAFYTLLGFNDKMIQFEAKFPSRRIIKTYHFPEEGADAPYCLIATIKVEGNTSGLWVSSGVPEVELISGSAAPIIKYSTVQNNRPVVEKLSLPKTATTMSSFQPDWVANSNGYFVLIMDPLSEIGYGFQANNIAGNADPSRIVLIDSNYDLYPASKYPGYELYMPLKRSSEPMTFRLYAGPLDHSTLKLVDATFTDPITGYSPRYIETQSFHGWFSFISEPFAKFLYFIMNFFHTLTGSWGLSIILLTVMLRLMMYPLNAWSIKSTLKMQEVSPKLKKLQDKHKKDPKRAQMEVMAFYKEHKVNPFGGCLPLIIQMPFLFGMFDLLKSTFSLRGASFIPGWINNLTAPDVLFSWSYPLPFFGTQFHLLPILLGVVMFFQQKMAAAKNKKSGSMTDQQKQQQKMGMIMTIVFTFMFYKFPSGLNIYWLSSMSLQILQQWYMSKRKSKNPPQKGSREIVVEPKKQK